SFSYDTVHHPHLHSFPTRRSSDLNPRTGSQLLELLSLGQNLHNHKSIEELLHKNLEDTVRTLNARGGALLLVDETTGQLTLQASDRKSTRLNSSHDQISYAVFCLK